MLGSVHNVLAKTMNDRLGRVRILPGREIRPFPRAAFGASSRPAPGASSRPAPRRVVASPSAGAAAGRDALGFSTDHQSLSFILGFILSFDS